MCIIVFFLVIRPAVAKTMLNKCDPVALYHYYQSEWKKTKIPGQDSRDDLRWAVRARMLSGPKVKHTFLNLFVD